MPIFLFMAAAALMAGGVATFSEARAENARKEAQRRQEVEAELLRGEINLQQLRDEARAKGLDPEEVVKGYLALREGDVSVDTVLRAIQRGTGIA